MSDILSLIEQQELIQKLINKGYKDLVEALMSQDDKVYTKKGRLNKSGLCRVLKWKPKQLEDAIEDCIYILTEND